MKQYWEVLYNLPGNYGFGGGGWADHIPQICQNNWYNLPSSGSLVDVGATCDTVHVEPGQGIGYLADNNVSAIYLSNVTNKDFDPLMDINTDTKADDGCDDSLFMTPRCNDSNINVYIDKSKFDIILKGSVAKTAYIHAQLEMDGQIQSVIVDSGSSLMAFPCYHCNEKQADWKDREQIGDHMYPVYCAEDDPERFIPCEETCEACFIHSDQIKHTTSADTLKSFCSINQFYDESKDETENVTTAPGTRNMLSRRQARLQRKLQDIDINDASIHSGLLEDRFESEERSDFNKRGNFSSDFMAMMSDADRGSFYDYLFLSQSELNKWMPNAGNIPLVRAVDDQGRMSGIYNICAENGEKNMQLTMIESPSLAGGRCAYEISYAEGSSLRGYYYTSKITNGGMSLPVVHGCTTLETHLFKDQKANGIMGLELWNTSTIESLLSSVYRKYFLNTKQKDAWSPVAHVCFSGDGGIMRFGIDLAEYRTTLGKDYENKRTTVTQQDVTPVVTFPGNIRRQSNTIGLVGVFIVHHNTKFRLVPSPNDQQKLKYNLIYGKDLFKTNELGPYHWMISPFDVVVPGYVTQALSNNPKFMGSRPPIEKVYPSIPVLLDSGTTISSIPENLYDQIVDIIDATVSDYNEETANKYRDLSQIREGVIPVTVEEKVPGQQTKVHIRKNKKRSKRGEPLIVLEDVPEAAQKRRRLKDDDVILTSPKDACWYYTGDFEKLFKILPDIEFEFLNNIKKVWISADYLYTRGEKWRCLSMEPSMGRSTHEMKLGMTFFINNDVGFYINYQDEASQLQSTLNEEYYRSSRFSLESKFMGSRYVKVGLTMNDANCPQHS